MIKKKRLTVIDLIESVNSHLIYSLLKSFFSPIDDPANNNFQVETLLLAESSPANNRKFWEALCIVVLLCSCVYFAQVEVEALLLD